MTAISWWIFGTFIVILVPVLVFWVKNLPSPGVCQNVIAPTDVEGKLASPEHLKRLRQEEKNNYVAYLMSIGVDGWDADAEAERWLRARSTAALHRARQIEVFLGNPIQ